MELVIVIHDREAIPVRALPFITGWAMSPDMVAASLAHTDLLKRLEGVSAYHLLPDGGYAAMLPKEWDGVEAELSTLSDTLKAAENVDWENYPEWRRRSVPLLPPGVFVWRDEFVKAFAHAYSPLRLDLVDERPGDRELNFLPHIPTELSKVVCEGFERASGMHGQVCDAPGPVRRQQLVQNYDSQHDPAFEAKHSYYFDLFCELDQLQDKLAEWECVATPTATDKALQESKIQGLKDQIVALQGKIDAKAEYSDIANGEMPDARKRTRSNVLSTEIDEALRQLGGSGSPNEVMKKLRAFAGKPGSCITDEAADGVLWSNGSGEPQKLNLLALRKRLTRRKPT